MNCLAEWDELCTDYHNLEADNKVYLQKLEELNDFQKKCQHSIAHQRHRMAFVGKSLRGLKTQNKVDSKTIEQVEKDLQKRKFQLYELEETLPKPNDTYLKIIVGNVNVSILNKEEKFKYKNEYEKFKLILSIIIFFLALLNLQTKLRALELMYIFLLVWYYCTLTIRESILRVNGSRIKGWWRIHHFILTFTMGVLLIWPDTEAWLLFKDQFMWFNGYISFVQYLQFRYQRGQLYRLKALGERYNMDITMEGFHSWMWRGLSFLLPFLFIGYVFQFYNAYTLWCLSFSPTATWHVHVLSWTFFILFFGNISTTLMVIPRKFKRKIELRHGNNNNEVFKNK